MIGVIADPADHEAVREFFELFKTPWEFYRSNKRYEVVICHDENHSASGARLIVTYAGRKTSSEDGHSKPATSRISHSSFLVYGENRIPVYGDTTPLVPKGNILLTQQDSKECAAYLEKTEATYRARVGYDLFSEVRTLLTTGQPVSNAGIPTLELHIAFLRDLMSMCGIAFVEIPPVPEGHKFIACLTHDVDHASIRQQKLDHTLIGFLFRATVVSLLDLLRRRISVRDAATNWVAAVKLPFAYIGLAKDFWRDFDQRYSEVEEGLPSTFFFITRKNYAGKRADGTAPALRAVRYEARELAGTIRELMATGHEVGLHGIDAWLDASAACQELDELRQVTGALDTGVRMHWLYYNDESPAILEKAGAAYDSTIGYNQTVGYRAGTTQAYKPFQTERLLELPLHAMDTALFYPGYLALSPRKAKVRLCEMVDNAAHYGGCLTINWHDRSLAPERLWGACYRDLVQELKARGAWFATASQAVSWFEKRRSIIFEMVSEDRVGVRTGDIKAPQQVNLPGLRCRHNQPRDLNGSLTRRSEEYVDEPVRECAETRLI